MNNGYIALHRKILDNPIVCKDSDYFTIWTYLLLNATHTAIDKIFKGEKTTLQPGQLLTGRKSIATKFNISESKVQRVLKRLETEHQIEQQTSNKNRLITVLNWHNYQKSEQQSEQPVNNQRTTSEQPVNTNNNVNKGNKGNKGKKDSITVAETDDTGDLNFRKKETIEKWFEAVWKEYPNKKGKGQVGKSHKAKVYKIKDEFSRALRRYKNETRETEKQYIMHGSTFFKSGYVDYLDDNYEPSDGVALIEEELKKRKLKRKDAEEKERRLFEEEKRKKDEKFKREYPQYEGMTPEQIHEEIKRNFGRVKTL